MFNTWTLVDFVAESNRIERIDHVQQAEIEAHEALLALPCLTVEAMQTFVAVVAPGHRLRDKPTLNVRVGNYVAPRGGPEIREHLAELLAAASSGTADPWRTHIAYERLHPFTDGNGRSGRALWLWMQGGRAPIGFLHAFYYQTLAADPGRAAASTRDGGGENGM